MTESSREVLLRRRGELEGRIAQLKRAARPKLRDRFLFWSSAITTVAGVLLAPPTGGASLGVAAAGIALLGLDIGNKILSRNERRNELAELEAELRNVRAQLHEDTP